MKTPDENPSGGTPEDVQHSAFSTQHSPEGTEGASPWAEEDAALKAALPHLKLPPKRQGPINVPKKREGPILPDLEGKRFRCPYCGKVSALLGHKAHTKM